MSKSFLVTNHKGGVGKTFVTVHAANLLAAQEGERILVVDSDGQADAYKFLTGTPPTGNQNYSFERVSSFLHVMWNPKCKSLKGMGVTEDEYDFILIDSDARLADTVKNILQNDIYRVIAPVNFQQLSIDNLTELFITVDKLYNINPSEESCELQEQWKRYNSGKIDEKEFRKEMYNSAKQIIHRIIIVPLAADEDRLSEKLKEFRVKTKTKVTHNMDWLPRETSNCLAAGTLIWDYEDFAPETQKKLKKYFERIVVDIND